MAPLVAAARHPHVPAPGQSPLRVRVAAFGEEVAPGVAALSEGHRTEGCSMTAPSADLFQWARSRMPRVLSYGGGLDSFAMLLLAILSGELPDVVVFVDVADGSPDRDPEDLGEWPGTYQHIREVVIPLCRAHGIEFVWLTAA